MTMKLSLRPVNVLELKLWCFYYKKKNLQINENQNKQKYNRCVKRKKTKLTMETIYNILI